MLVDFSRALTAIVLLSGSATALAAEPTAAPSTPSKEMRENMATIHERMAACLRSDKPFAECRQAMQQSCSNMMGGQGCPMMGMGQRGRMMTPPQDE
jgi:hypothetical protein